MEEPAVESGVRVVAGLLRKVAFVLLCSWAFCTTAVAEEVLKLILSVEKTDEYPGIHEETIGPEGVDSGGLADFYAGDEVTFVVLIDYPSPRDVAIDFPPPPTALHMTRSSVRSVLVPGPSGNDESWTEGRFSFTLQTPGSWSIGPILVRAGSAKGEISNTELRVLPKVASAGAPVPTLEWQVPGMMEVGKPATLILRAIHLPKADLEAAPAPSVSVGQGYLLEVRPRSTQPRGASEAQGGAVLATFTLTPIEPGRHEIPKAELNVGNRVIKTRSTYFSATLPPAHASADLKGAPAQALPSVQKVLALDAQSYAERARELAARFEGGLFDGASILLALAAGALNRGDVAVALSTLRAAERSFPWPGSVCRLREDLELEVLGAVGRAPLWSPRFITGIGAVLLLIAVGIFPLLRVTLHIRRGFKIAVATVLLECILAFWIVSVERNLSGAAVLRSTSMRRVPERSSGIAAEVKEGQDVRLKASASGWYYVETSSGVGGWVEDTAVVRY